MRKSVSVIFRSVAICVVLLCQSALAGEAGETDNTPETVVRWVPVLTPPTAASWPVRIVPELTVGFSYAEESALNACKPPSEWNADKCYPLLMERGKISSFKVYRAEQIDKRFGDLPAEVDSLNRRMAEDEAAIPAEVDRYAVQKLLSQIKELESRVKTLEDQAKQHRP